MRQHATARDSDCEGRLGYQRLRVGGSSRLGDYWISQALANAESAEEAVKPWIMSSGLADSAL